MKKDIEIPKVDLVYVAAVYEWNEEFNVHDWNAYLINENTFPLETALIVSKGYEGKTATSVLRHTIKVLPAKSYAKIELMQPEVFKLTNEFSVSFFAEGKMLHKKFIFKKNSIKEGKLTSIPLHKEKGIIAE